MSRAVALVGLFVVGCGSGVRDRELKPLVSPFNGLELDAGDDWTSYSFAVMGHMRTGRGIPPPLPSLKDNVATLVQAEPDFVVALGDLYQRAGTEIMQEFRDWTEANVPVPFFNAVGNHDIQNGGALLSDGTISPVSYDPAAYIREFGPTYFHFSLGSELFVFLNFEVPRYTLKGEQLEYLRAIIEFAADSDAIANVFLFTHKVVWSYRNPALDVVFRYRHPVPVPDNYSFFVDEMKPLLIGLAPKKVFLFAGDIGGGNRHLQMFSHREQNLTYIATGMGSPDRDCFVDVAVNDGAVSMETVVLRSGEVTDVDEFGTSTWETFYSTFPDLADEALFRPKEKPKAATTAH